MFSEFSLKNGWKSIAEIIDKDKEKKIRDGKMKKYQKKYVFLKEVNSPDEREINEVLFKDKNTVLKPLLFRQAGHHPNRVYLAGQSLCGKSYMASQLAKDYNEIFPKNKVALFSYIDNDENLNAKKIKKFVKINIDESLVEDPIDLKEELHDKLVIFDDIEHYPEKDIRKELCRLRTSCLNAGRHDNIDVIICRQQLLDGHESKPILNGAFQIIGFPHTASRYHLKEWLKRYMYLPNEMVDKIINVPSRWVLINNAVPAFCLHEKGCFLLR